MRARTLLVALFLSPALAHAQTAVSLYGVFDNYLGSARTSVNGVSRGAGTVVNGGGMSTSFWGVKGAEDLGHGVSAVFALEGFFRGDTGESGRSATDSLFSKSAYVGLAGSFGRVTLGRQTTPLYITAGGFNPFGTSVPFSATIIQGYRALGAIYPAAPLAGDSAWSNSIRYATPARKGLRADLMVQLPEPSGTLARNRNRGVAGALIFQRGKLNATAGYQGLNLATGTDGRTQDVYNVGLAYDFGIVKPFVQLYRIEDSFGDASKNDRHDMAMLGASVPLAGGRLLAGYGRTATIYIGAGMAHAQRDTCSLGFDYPLSARTDVYTSLKSDRAKRAALSAKDQLLGLGIRHQF